jgi:AAA family ATP:ADP antiporter
MTTTRSKNYIERFLNLFTEVKEGEGTSAILLLLNLFLIFTSYYIMKPVREALILAGGGAEIKSYSAAGQALLFLGLVPLYARLASRFPRRQLINAVTSFFVVCLAVFYLLALLRVPLGVIFYLWLGIFNMMVPAQFWAFANDIYTPEAGKRIFVIIALGASSGSVLGGMITGVLIEPLGVYQPLLVAGALLLASLVLTNIVDSRDKADRHRTEERTVEVSQPFEKKEAFRLVFKTKYLLLIALLMLFANWVNTTGEYILGRTVQNRAEELAGDPEVAEKASEYAQKRLSKGDAKDKTMASMTSEYIKSYTKEYIGKFYAKFYTVVNLTGLLVQLFLVSRIIKYLGIRIALLVLPFIALCGYSVIVFIPIMTIIRWTKTAENSTDYSLQNTVRHALFLPTTREEKYKAKQATDTFFVRAGDVLSAVLVYVGTTLCAFKTSQFALFCVGLVMVWFALAVVIGIENKKMTKRGEESPMV